MLERTHWSDAHGNPVHFDRTQSPQQCPESWEPVVTISTDPDGYQYASVFKYVAIFVPKQIAERQ